MNWGALKDQLLKQGLTVLAGAIGGPGGIVAATVGRELAARLGVSTPEEVAASVATPEGRDVAEAFEAERADALIAIGQAQHELALAETKSERPFQALWRPAMSWLLIVMWTWNTMILPVAVGITGVAIDGIPYDQLLAFTGIWLTIYGGGHTLKSVMGTKG